MKKSESAKSKSSVDFFCSLLESLGITGVTPEILRQAKQNNSSAAFKFWRPLHDLICLQLCCFPQIKGNHPPPSTGVRNVAPVLQEVWSKSGGNMINDDQEECISFIKFFLALWGYPSHSRFFKLRMDTQQSRELLLALGWLASHCDVFLRGIETRIQSLLQEVQSTSFPLPLPVDVSASASDRAREVHAGVEEQIARMISAGERAEDPENFLSQQLMLVHGRTGLMLKSIHSLAQCKARRIHQLNEAQVAGCSQRVQPRMYSQSELSLLQGGVSKQSQLQAALESEKRVREELAQFEQHEESFWRWMESVAESEMESETTMLLEPASVSGVSDAELAPLIQLLKDSRECADVFPIKQELLMKLSSSFTAESESEHQHPRFPGESGFKNVQSPAKTNVKEAIDRLASALDKLGINYGEMRNKHKSVIESKLKCLIEDPSYVVAGL